MSKISFTGLRRFNLFMGLLHALQGSAIFWLANPNKGVQAVHTTYLTVKDPAQLAITNKMPELVQAQHNIFNVNIAYLVAGFFFMSALAHLFIATLYRRHYEDNLKKGINKVRWFEYALSASTMMVAIGLLSGIWDIGLLALIFVLTAVMNLMGLVMEIHNQTTDRTNWLSFKVGCLAGVMPWAIIGLGFWGTNRYGLGEIPSFVYWIYATLFVFFNCFAINMYLQYKKIGPWANYLYGERVYIILSLVAKSALAWQVFAGALS